MSGMGGSQSGGKLDMSFPDAPSMSNMAPNSDHFARIKRPAYVATIFIFLALSVMAASFRTFLRIYRFRTFTLDDMFLVLAVLFMAASTGVVFASKDFTYTQFNVSLGLVQPPEDFAWQMVQFETLDNVETVLVWGAIFSVKFSFVMFFRKLIDRVKGMKILWWFVLSVLMCVAPINMFLGFYICANFTENLLEICTNAGMVHREGIYLIVTVVLDIFTDLLVISIPFALLSQVKLSLKRKLALLTVLSLSAFMIVIAIIRVTLSNVTSPHAASMPTGMPEGMPTTVPDSIWLFFWQELEACVAVLMVSLTAFRSMLGQQSPRSKPGKHGYGSSGSGKTGSLATRGEKPRLFERFRRQRSQERMAAGSDPSYGQSEYAQGSPLKEQKGFDRSKISLPVSTPVKVVPVPMTRMDHGSIPLPRPPPIPAKDPRWQGLVGGQARGFDESSEEFEMGHRHARSESFV